MGEGFGFGAKKKRKRSELFGGFIREKKGGVLRERSKPKRRGKEEVCEKRKGLVEIWKKGEEGLVYWS